MTAYIIDDQRIGVQPIEEVSTTQNHPLGTRVKATDGTYGQGEFIYLKGVTGGSKGAWVTINLDEGTCTLLAGNAIGGCGVMMSELDAATDFGWVQIYGTVAAAKCLTSFADNGKVFITACVGYVDDTSVAGDWVQRCRGASTSTARSADFEIEYPFVNDIAISA